MEWPAHFLNLLWNFYFMGNIKWHVVSAPHFELNTSNFFLHEKEKYAMCGKCVLNARFTFHNKKTHVFQERLGSWNISPVCLYRE
jgi:hypothetical protein